MLILIWKYLSWFWEKNCPDFEMFGPDCFVFSYPHFDIIRPGLDIFGLCFEEKLCYIQVALCYIVTLLHCAHWAHCVTLCYIVTLCTLCYIQVAVTVHGEECALTRFLHCKYSAQNILNILLEISIVWTFLSGLARPKHWETFTFQTKASKDCDSFNWSTKRSFEMWKLQQRSQNQIEARGFSDQGRPLAAL